MGDSLIKGVVTPLPAIALSIKPGGFAHSIEVTGGLKAHRAGIPPLEVHGAVGDLRVSDIVADTQSEGASSHVGGRT